VTMLATYLNDLPKERLLWQFESAERKVSDIKSWLLQCENVGRFHDKFIVLATSDPLRFSYLLVLLDGLASDILLLPNEMIAGDCPFDLEDLGADFIFADGEQERGSLSKGQCQYIDLEEWFVVDNQISSSLPKSSRVDLDEVVTNWIIPTSGTTGVPKLIPHSLGSLSRSVKIDLIKGADFSWGLMYQLSRFAGVQVFLQCFMSGSTLIFTSVKSSPVSIVDELLAGSCNALSATATMYRKLLMARGFTKLKLRQITFGGEIADQQILGVVKKLFPDARVTHIYASTEAGVGFAVTDGQAGFPSAYVGSTTLGVDIKVSEDGILLLRTPGTDRSLLGCSTDVMDAEGFIITGDIVRKINNRYIFMGRANGAINVGGNKVQPEEVEQVLLQVPEVRLVAVHGKRSSITGQVVVANVVPNSDLIDPIDLRNIVLNHCRIKLEDYKIPAIIKVVSDLETNESGKIQRR
jgi:acyl-coenzyme A synthetase/AMP-(fatty) acid ligase